MAQWLMGLSVAAASRNPDDWHAQSLACTSCLHFLQKSWKQRLRASVFINLVKMREAISMNANKHCTLSRANIQKLQESSYLYHAALNGQTLSSSQLLS